MKFLNIDHIYIVHCDQFQDRFKYLKKTFDNLNLSCDYYDFVTNTYKDTLTDTIISKYYNTNTDTRLTELKIIGEDKYLTKNISKGNISCGINHINIWNMVKESSFNNVLILEDDILFLEKSINNLVEVTMQLPKDFDIISLEDGAGLTVSNYIKNKNKNNNNNIVPEKLLYKIPDGRMRCTGSYIINKNTCTKLLNLNNKRKFTLEIDMQLWLYGKLKLLNVYWAEPNVFTQGSQRGVYKSCIQEEKTKDSTDHYPYLTKLFTENLDPKSNKRCIDIDCSLSNGIIEIHNFSALLFGNTKSPVKAAKYPVKHFDQTLSNEEIANNIKENHFEGDLDILLIKKDVTLLKFLLYDSIIVNPNIIVTHINYTDAYTSLLHDRYTLYKKVEDYVLFIRK
jgi:GR25 family glycosyltransferase involved in LPS biosynthesis